jgi:NADH-quinone oxidoreductase chain I
MLKKILYKIFFIEIMKGMALTMSRLFSHAVTRQYPTEPRPAMAGFRGLHALVTNPDGTPRCVHCGACQAVCPSRCIHLSITKDSEGKAVKNYEIDVLRCVFCGLCVEACPYFAIVLTEHYEYCDYTRDSFRLSKATLLDNWGRFMGEDKGNVYREHFWSPKATDYAGADDQPVFDPARIESKRRAMTRERK